MAQNQNWPLTCWQANFATGANAAIPTLWDDLTVRIESWGTTGGKQFELNAVEAGTASGQFNNLDEALNPANGSSPYNSGGKSLKAFRWLRAWQAWPLTGNLLNAANDVWAAPYNAGTLADSAGFEGNTTGTWAAVAGATAAASAVRAHDGSKSLLITWSTTAGGAGVAEISAVAVPLKAGTVYTLSAWVWIGAGPAVTLSCNGFSAASTASTGAWQRVVRTFTAQSSVSTNIRVWATGATTSGQQVWIDSVQLEVSGSASAFTASGPTIYPIWCGYWERYPLQWYLSGFMGRVNFTATDALAFLSRVDLSDALTSDQMQDRPVFLWPLTDAQGQIVLTNTGVQAASSGVMALAPWGFPASVTTTLGGQGSPGVDSQTSLTFAPLTAVDTYGPVDDWFGSTGYVLGGNTAGWSFEIWFLANSTARTMRILRVWGASGLEEISLDVTATGTVQFLRINSGGSTDTTVTTTGTYADGSWHHAVITGSSDGIILTETLTVDGQLAGSITHLSGTTMTARGAVLGYNVRASSSAFSGQLSRFAIYAGALSPARISSHWLAARTGFSGDTADQRIARVLGWAGWRGPTVLPAGLTRLGPASGLGGTSAVDACKTAAATDNGAFLAAPDGRLTFVPRTAYYTQPTSGVTFGESVAGGEVPYLDASAELDPTFIYNAVSVSRAGGSSQTVYDTASAADYGVRSVDLSTQHATDEDAAGMGAHLLLQYRDGHLRVPLITIRPSHRPSLWPVALGVSFGDRVTWKRRTSSGLTVVIDGFVEQISRSSAPDNYTVTLGVSPVSVYQPGLVGDSTYGIVGSTLRYTY